MRIIFVPVDFSPVSKAVVGLACREARLSDAQLHLFHVSQRSEAMSSFEREEHDMMSLAEDCRRQGTEVKSETKHGDPAAEIVAAIERVKPDLVVVGSHGHGAVYDLVVGSVAETLLRRSPCPILVVPPLAHDH